MKKPDNNIYLINTNNLDIIGFKLNEGHDYIEISKPRILFKNNFGIAVRKLPYLDDNDNIIVKHYNYIYKINDDFLINFYYGKIKHDDK